MKLVWREAASIHCQTVWKRFAFYIVLQRYRPCRRVQKAIANYWPNWNWYSTMGSSKSSSSFPSPTALWKKSSSFPPPPTALWTKSSSPPPFRPLSGQSLVQFPPHPGRFVDSLVHLQSPTAALWTKSSSPPPAALWTKSSSSTTRPLCEQSLVHLPPPTRLLCGQSLVHIYLPPPWGNSVDQDKSPHWSVDSTLVYAQC